jgi:hypothetical protein
MTVMIITYKYYKICFLHTLHHTYLGSQALLAPFAKQIESFHLPHGIGRLTFSHQWLGLAVFSFACPYLAADHRPNSNTYK